MFGWFKKKIDKDLEFKIRVIQDVGTLKAQNEFIWNRVKELQDRIDLLEEKGNGTI